MIRNQAFLTIEAALQRLLWRHWRAAASPLVAKIAEAAAAGDWDEAHDLVDDLTFEPLTQVRPQARLFATTALVFGGATLHKGSSRKAQVAKSRATVQVAEHAIDTMFVSLRQAGTLTLRERVHELIRRAEAGNLRVQKAGDPALAALLNKATMTGAKLVVDTQANLTTSRLVSYGFLAEAEEATTESYLISAILDDRTCPVCLRMDGRTFQVDTALGRAEKLLLTRDADELREMAPFPKGSLEFLMWLDEATDEEVQAAGFDLPPYHPNCRCIPLPVPD